MTRRRVTVEQVKDLLRRAIDEADRSWSGLAQSSLAPADLGAVRSMLAARAEAYRAVLNALGGDVRQLRDHGEPIR